MNPVFWITYGLQWLVLAVVVMLLVLLYRQFGLMLMPGSQRINYGGLDIGSSAPAVLVRADNQAEVVYDWRNAGGDGKFSATFALLALPTCPLCKTLASDNATAFVAERYPTVRFIWIDGGHAEPNPALSGWTILSSRHGNAHEALDIPGTPFAYLVSTESRIMSKGLINSVTDIESILKEAGEWETAVSATA